MNPREQFPLESLLSARQLVSAKISDDTVFFISNLSGRYSLYSMDNSGSIPVPLLPEGVALQNPHLMAGANYELFPKIDKIVVMIDTNGDELYQPNIIPIIGGIPSPLFGDEYDGMQVMLFYGDPNYNMLYFGIDDRKSPGVELISYNFNNEEKVSYGKTPYGKFLCGLTEDHTKIAYQEGYGFGDICLYLIENGKTTLLFGKPLDQRKEGEEIVKSQIGHTIFVEDDQALLFNSILDDDRGSFNWLNLEKPDDIRSIETRGISLPEVGELEYLVRLEGNQLAILYNVDGVSHYYLAYYHVSGEERYIEVTEEIIGNNTILNNGVELSINYDEIKARKEGKVTEFVVSFTKTTSPSQLFLINTEENTYAQLSNERVLGIPSEFLSEGEDASFNSYDGLRISARLYLPSENLNFQGPRPLVVYVHGGPQSQERPDFTWFSMPLIQYLTLNGFAVFVPNVRGSSGYGFTYMQKVERDWGGDDMKDHIFALQMLEKDERIDSTRRAVTGRSYGGYMTLSLVSRHPDKWQAACDMFGPYDLLGFYRRLPPSWQTSFDHVLGHPERDRDFLIERSPKTYFDNIQSPLLVIQGANDPRVTLEESKEIFEELKAKGKDVELLVFEDEGHDVIKFKNRVICYNKIVDYFKKYLIDK